LWCFRQWNARRRQDMERHLGAPRERLDGCPAVTAQFRGLFDDRAQGRRDAGGVETWQHGIDGRARAVTRHHDRDLLRRQATLAGFTASFACRPWQATAFALEGFKDERLVRLDDPGQARGLIAIKSLQEPMPPPERGCVVHAATRRGFRYRFTADQSPRLCLAAVHAAIAGFAVGLAPGTNVITTAMRASKAGQPALADL